MTINVNDLRIHIIRPVLQSLDLYSQAAENLLLGTAAQESRMGFYVRQINGVALGIYQMEPDTYYSIKNDYLAYKPALSKKVDAWSNGTDDVNQLVINHNYSTAMARLKYAWIKEPLPEASDIRGLAQYWKKYYNTPAGKGTIDEFISNYMDYVG